jgi:fructose-bisphosphate aldolase class II
MVSRVVREDGSLWSRWKTLRQTIDGASGAKIAIGHFNASELVALNGIVSGARDAGVPVIVGATEKERAFAGVRQLAALVRSFRDERGLPVFLNADHTHSLGSALAAARAGFDAIGFDASALPFDENVGETRRAVIALKSINPEILVEGEIGNIGMGSRIHMVETKEAKTLSTPDEARQFVSATGVDLLAPAIGTMHGLTLDMVSGLTKKRLNIERIREIRAAAGVPLVLHGGSGTEEADFELAVAAGVSIVHVNTEVRLALREGLMEGLATSDMSPYTIMTPACEAVRRLVQTKLRSFNTCWAVAGVAR